MQYLEYQISKRYDHATDNITGQYPGILMFFIALQSFCMNFMCSYDFLRETRSYIVDILLNDNDNITIELNGESIELYILPIKILTILIDKCIDTVYKYYPETKSGNL